MATLIIPYILILPLFITAIIIAFQRELSDPKEPKAKLKRNLSIDISLLLFFISPIYIGLTEAAFKIDPLKNYSVLDCIKKIPSKEQIDDFNKEYYRLIFQSNNAVKDTADFITMSGLKRIDSLNTRINEINAVIDRCNKHYKSDFWNGRLYPIEIWKKPKIRNIDVSDVKISVKPQN